MFTIKIVQAKFGDCFILHYGTKESPKHMLIDGGPGGVYRNFLKEELKKINDKGEAIELAVLSHVDGDHIVGLIDLTEDLREQQADEEKPLIKVHGFWMNTFASTLGADNELGEAIKTVFSTVNTIQSAMPEGDRALQSINQGNILRRNTLLLDIPINEIVDGGTLSNESIPEPVHFDNLKMTVIGPNKANLEKLKEEWKKWIIKNEEKLVLSDNEVLAYLDKSVPNLSSLMFLIEEDDKSALFTGDGRGDFIIEGLEQAGRLDDDGKIHLNIFKVPHHGSIRNASEDFFHRITADYYIISADGHHGNPDFESLELIIKAAHNQQRAITIYCTNTTTATEEISNTYPPKEYGYTFEFLNPEATSFDLDVMGL